MQVPEKKELIKIISCLVLALICFFGSLPESLRVDSRASDYYDKAITQAGVAYASIRLINASVTIIKESELQLQPAGIGVSLAVGQVLDPLNDMTERVSNVLVWSITALGLQKLVHELCILVSSAIIGSILLLLALSFISSHQKVITIRELLYKLLIAGILIRLFLPISAFLNIELEQAFFKPRIEQAHRAIQIHSVPMDHFSDFTLPKSSGAWDFIDNTSEYVEQKTQYLKQVFKRLVDDSSNIINSLLTITYLYVALFIVQIILLPLLLFWLFYKGLSQLL